MRALRCRAGRVGFDPGDTLFALDVDDVGAGMDEGAGNVLNLEYNVGASM